MSERVSDDNLAIFCNEIGATGMIARELRERRKIDKDEYEAGYAHGLKDGRAKEVAMEPSQSTQS